MTEQERWQLATDILDQLWQELRRIREGKSLSNSAGIRRSLDMLTEDVRRNEKPEPASVKL